MTADRTRPDCRRQPQNIQITTHIGAPHPGVTKRRYSMERILHQAASQPTDRGFEQAEFDERLRRAQGKMDEHDVDVLILNDQADIQYLTGARDLAGSLPMALIVPREGLYTLVTRKVDALAFLPQSGRAYVVEYPDEESPAKAIAIGVNAYEIEEPVIGLSYSAKGLSARFFGEIQSSLSAAAWKDTGNIVWGLTARKSEAELEHMRDAADLNGLALRDAVQAMAPGVADHEVAAALVGGLLKAGSHMTPGYYQIVSGQRTATAHATHNGSTLADNDHVLFEFSAARYRYVSPLMRTATVGRPSPELRRMHDAAQAALEAAIAVMRPGVTSGSVHKAADEALESYGMRDLRPHRTGYIVGTAPMSTGWPQGHIMNLRDHDTSLLEEGMTFHLPLALYQPGSAAVGISETVVVKPHGGEPLGDIPRGLLSTADFDLVG